MTGGAMAKIDNGQWVHMLCALLIPDALFKIDYSVKQSLDEVSTKEENNTSVEENEDAANNGEMIDGAEKPFIAKIGEISFDVQANTATVLCCYCDEGIGRCLKCHRCTAVFHVSCGLVAGALYVNSASEPYKLEVC